MRLEDISMLPITLLLNGQARTPGHMCLSLSAGSELPTAQHQLQCPEREVGFGDEVYELFAKTSG